MYIHCIANLYSGVWYSLTKQNSALREQVSSGRAASDRPNSSTFQPGDWARLSTGGPSSMYALCWMSHIDQYICRISVPLFPCQGVCAEQKELEVRPLEARLQASEKSMELLKSISTPQVRQQGRVGRYVPSRQI